MILATLLSTSALLADTGRAARAPYWQQEVAYDITARLDEPTATLRGHERIRYVNRSPDTLSTFSLHLHLNAFRPGSRWSAVDEREQRRRFQHLQEPDFAFNHVRDIRIMGQPVTPVYPFAPDSTIVRFELPRALAPGEAMTVELDWDARPSTTFRRQGRKGRHYDFAHWYPKVVVYDKHGWQEKPLEPAGEFYGEFATWRVQLDMAEDQVIGATGVPACGDPGWERANRGGRAVQYGRDVYGTVLGEGCAFPSDFLPTTPVAPGDKRVLWVARDVHNFALSVDPEYRHEGGQWGRTLIHVLYRPGDDSTWSRVAVERTAKALEWLDRAFGPFAWPQITNLHRLDPGGTEFPMVIMDGSAGQGLIVHELGHNYVMGILASNEWKEAWLDEGFSDFQEALFEEWQGGKGYDPEYETYLLQLDLDGRSEPTSQPAQAYRDFSTYNTSAYSGGAEFLHRLRYIVGEETMSRILREYYRRWKLKHVDEEAFREVAEEVSGRDLTTYFAQGLHGIVLKDYAVGRVERATAPGGEADGWVTRVEVKRLEQGIVPVEVFVLAERDTAMVRAEGLQPSEWVEVRTASKPREVWLDPRVQAGDWNMLNNRHRFGGDLASTVLLLDPQRPLHPYLDTWFSQPIARDRVTQGWMPMLWYNDAGGVTLGVRSRGDYLGRYERNQFWLSYSTGDVQRLDFFLRAKDPVWLRAPGFSPTFEAFRIEGRWGGLLRAAWQRTPHQGFGPTRTTGLSLRLVGVDDARFVDPGQYEPVGVTELGVDHAVTTRANGWRLGFAASVGGGLVFDRENLAALGRERDEFYGRATLEGTARRRLGTGKWLVGGRAFAGVAGGGNTAAPLQRQMFAANPDPFGQLNNPFLRSQGAILVGDDMAYHAPGGGNVRGADFRIAAPALVAANAELEFEPRRKPNGKLFNRIAVAGFADAAQGIGRDNERPSAERLEFLADAGVGLRASHRIGDTPFETRIDFPLWLSEPAFARNDFARDGQLDFRWTFSVQAAF